MATAREIIGPAYREANFKDSAAVPTTTELTEGLALLQGIVDSFAGMVAGIRVQPWYVPPPQRTGTIAANFPLRPSDDGQPLNPAYPPANSRLMMRNPEDTTVWFQYQPQDGAVMEYIDVGHEGTVTLDANGALFGLTGSVEEVVIDPLFPAGRNTPRRWLYRGDYGSWLEVSALALDSPIPFPTAFDDYFTTALAMRLSPRFGQEPRQITVLRYQQMESFIRAQWKQDGYSIGQEMGVPSLQSYNARYTGAGFERGDI